MEITRDEYLKAKKELNEMGLKEENQEVLSEDEQRIKLGIVYEKIIQVLKRYCDLDEKYYSLIAIWIIGTHYHKDFPTYPYLFFNAMKGSGKSRLLKLITTLAKDGCMLNSLTEAVMFRTQGTLGIDEFEGLNRKGKENLSELLNSAYKKGTTVKRIKKVKVLGGEEQVVEEFDVYRPIVLANISGMDSVLNDRCITIILNKSNKPNIIKKIEIYTNDKDIQEIYTFFQRKGVVGVECICILEHIEEWNNYIDTLYTPTTSYTLTTLTTLTTPQEKLLSFFNKMNEAGIDGRNLELSFPLLILANYLNESIFDELLTTFKEIVEEKKKDDVVENLDVSLLDFISGYEEEQTEWISIKDLFQKFKEFIRMEEDWFNERWMGRALKRLNLIKEKKRMKYGIVVKLDYLKAQEKIRMFK